MLFPNYNSLLYNKSTSQLEKPSQAMMAPIFYNIPSLDPGERFAMMQEVFYMSGWGAAMRGDAGSGRPDGEPRSIGPGSMGTSDAE